MRVFLDIDRTIFDTDRFVKDLKVFLERENISWNEFLKYQEQTKKNGFNPYLILHAMEKDKIMVNKDTYDHLALFLKDLSLYIYPDVLPFMERMQEKGYLLGILSYGNHDFQYMKLFNNPYHFHFDTILCSLENKWDLEISYPEDYFIDDNLEEIAKMKDDTFKKIIRMQRDGAKYSDLISNKDIETVNSLEEVII